MERKNFMLLALSATLIVLFLVSNKMADVVYAFSPWLYRATILLGLMGALLLPVGLRRARQHMVQVPIQPLSIDVQKIRLPKLLTKSLPSWVQIAAFILIGCFAVFGAYYLQLHAGD